MIEPGQVWNCELSRGNHVTFLTVESYFDDSPMSSDPEMWRCLMLEYTNAPACEGLILCYDRTFIKRLFKRIT